SQLRKVDATFVYPRPNPATEWEAVTQEAFGRDARGAKRIGEARHGVFAEEPLNVGSVEREIALDIPPCRRWNAQVAECVAPDFVPPFSHGEEVVLRELLQPVQVQAGSSACDEIRSLGVEVPQQPSTCRGGRSRE